MKTELIRVDLTKLESNPMRDFDADPVDEESIDRIADSIGKLGFWSGITAREHPDKPGVYQLGGGQTRTLAAIKKGIRYHEITVGKYDDFQMIELYATENSTHRQSTATSLFGSVASMLRFAIADILRGGENLARICARSARAIETLRGNLESGEGLGGKLIAELLQNVPGLVPHQVQDQMANIRASGVYARIVKEEVAKFDAEQKAEREELERREREAEAARVKAEKARVAAEKAAAEARQAEKEKREAAKARAEAARKREEEAAAEKKKKEAEVEKMANVQKGRETSRKAAAKAAETKASFDYAGVRKFLRNEHQVNMFREAVDNEEVRKYLPFDQQAVLAKQLVEAAQRMGKREISGDFIKTNLSMVLAGMAADQAGWDRKRKQQWEEQDVRARWRGRCQDFAVALGNVYRQGANMVEVMEKYRHLNCFTVNDEMLRSISRARKMIDDLDDYFQGRRDASGRNGQRPPHSKELAHL